MAEKAGGYAGEAVAVIGNGPVGQTTALLLARWGIPVVLLDVRPARSAVGSKAIVQQRDVLDVWESVGAGRHIAAEGLTWTRARTFYRNHELFCLEFRDPGRSTFPPFVNISQSRTEEILDERIAAEPLIKSRWATEVTGVSQHDAGVTLTCQAPDGVQTIRAPFVVACGGPRSDPLRAALGLRFPGRTFEDHFLICDIRTELPGWERERRFYFDPEWNPGRQVLIHPCPDSVFRIDWQVPPDFDLAREETNGGLDRRIRHVIGDRDYQLVWHSVYRFHARHVDRMRIERVLVAGDCAHLVSPFGARGLNSGVQDAENAAWKIAFVLNGWADDGLLESYHDERLAAAIENINVTSDTMDFLVPQSTESWSYRRNVLERAVDDPSARALVDSGRLAEPFWYVDSPLTTPNPERRFPGRPPRGQAPAIAPGVILPDVPIRIPGSARISRTREIARDGLLALTTNGVDVSEVSAVIGAATSAPFRVLPLADIDDGTLADVIEAKPGEVWLIRPDAHIAAAVVATPDILHAAVKRCLGSPVTIRT
ncbi:FAD-dependent monooxygenase [Phytohabitans rumicis]|uniref:Oxidoreductase n=1 Tax=Phytohabitans rumicis TaxID=1076125 RepID=A0A6V8KZR7_9ACTN|nr:FAD-dependent monooxygenase [Phytohabitans rumicis]GFJ87809.1 oxidoreductase [Phytohabitans rumicis]